MFGIQIWRIALNEGLDDLAQAIIDDLGPIRARTVTVSTTETALVVELTTGDPDHDAVAWWAVVWLSQLWAPTMLLDGVPVDLEVTIGDRTWPTPAATMTAVAQGAHREIWATATGRPPVRHLRAVE